MKYGAGIINCAIMWSLLIISIFHIIGRPSPFWTLVGKRQDSVLFHMRHLTTLRNNEESEDANHMYREDLGSHPLQGEMCLQDNSFPSVMVNSSADVHAKKETESIGGAEFEIKDYQHSQNGTDYKHWLEEKLIPNMPLGRSVVTDNVPYHRA
jgi:hypothetical protein